MFYMRYATDADEAFWFAMDKHLPESEFALKVRDKRAYVLCEEEVPVGLLRYNLMYDFFPFLTLIILQPAQQGKGYGTKAMAQWEAEMHTLGHRMVITSTQVDETAQHFYRKLGYVDRGGLYLDGTPFAQAQELFLIKNL